MIEFKERVPGIVVAAVSNSAATAEISLYGAHALSYAPKGQRDVLFLSRKSSFAVGKPIRGGIPLCFPWFGPHAENAALPMHGFARISAFVLSSIHETPERTTLVLSLRDTEETRRLWPHAFELRLEISVGATLDMAFTVRNVDRAAFSFANALHSYFAVKDVNAISVEGLDGLDYIDRVGGRVIRRQAGPVSIEGETDRIYLGSKAVAVRDPGLGRSIGIERTALPDLVVWNPWIAKSKAMTDFGDDEYIGMVCAEAASVFENAISLEPGDSSRQMMSIRCGP